MAVVVVLVMEGAMRMKVACSNTSPQQAALLSRTSQPHHYNHYSQPHHYNHYNHHYNHHNHHQDYFSILRNVHFTERQLKHTLSGEKVGGLKCDKSDVRR